MVKDNRSLQSTPAQQAILTTLLYSDIFSFPLTADELWLFLLSKEKISREEFRSCIQALRKNILYKDGYYCLLGRESLITKRINNKEEVAKKLQRARFIAEKLSAIPSILFVGITGGLAAENVTPEDDIDFVIIVKKNTLFISRLLILGVLECLGVRRFRNLQKTANTICVNLLFDETALSWFSNSQDIYTAREIAQIVPLFERDKIYQKFMFMNKWIKHFLPNVRENKPFLSVTQQSFIEAAFYNYVFNSFLESVFRSLQTSWMKRHQTNETVTKHILAFHPINYRIKTLKQLRLKMRQFGLLTKF